MNELREPPWRTPRPTLRNGELEFDVWGGKRSLVINLKVRTTAKRDKIISYYLVMVDFTDASEAFDKSN